jgi:starch-binding outer membrane protein, SusD/RagB family
MKRILFLIVTFALVLNYSCSEDDLDPTLSTQKSVETSITSLEDLQGLLNGMYNRFTSYYYYGRDYIIFGEVRSDNCFSNANSGRFITASAMTVGETDSYSYDTWTQMYAVIASSNIIIAQESKSLEGDKDEINQVVGQAYIGRALAHFDLLQLFGEQNVYVKGTLSTDGIPYVITYKGDDLTPARNTVSEVYSYIMADLDKALSLMNESLNGSDAQYLTTFAAYALKARVAAYFKDWSVVKSSAEEVITNGNYSIIDESKFVSSWKTDNNVNSIFELAFSSTDNQNINGLQYIYRGDSYGDIEVLDDLLTIFDAGDVRASKDMIDYDDNGDLRNLGKYPSSDYSDNIPLIRYEEVYLLLAEAKIELGESDALATLNEVPSHRGATLYTEATKANVMLERRKELCFEGFRFNDLARTGSDIPLVDDIHQTHGGPTYGSYNYAFPIPLVEINANPNIEQNYGY